MCLYKCVQDQKKTLDFLGLEIQTVETCHVGTRILTWALRKSNQCSNSRIVISSASLLASACSIHRYMQTKHVKKFLNKKVVYLRPFLALPLLQNELFPIIALLSTAAFCRRLCSPHTEGKGIYSSEAELSFRWVHLELLVSAFTHLGV